ncbi:hypothetical protein AncyloWKF20_05635 [Ancylobacter sp. WKF20]|uniref:hypothetical protein n=1 Tax=Ancylobacter sp. WKF20 TaxID=3039801 RepID=UPI0024341E84|nr:hypothetical protein [Ancylobacter sp. WKF20]WGD31307.1 hypothetical protein AncyloWKF20_05635 [Ancylobacter sp. WKF20]
MHIPVDPPADPLAELLLGTAQKVAEGSKLLGAEGVFWRLCGLQSPHEIIDFAHAERARGTGAEHLMEGVAVWLANHAFNIATQTDHPEMVCRLMVQAFAVQLQAELNSKAVGVSVEPDGRRNTVTVAGLLRKPPHG